MVDYPPGSTMAALLCPYCGEDCIGPTIIDSQQVCCGSGCEHCCQVDRDDDETTGDSGA